MTAKLKPSWAGDDLLSQFVNALISIKPIFTLMKQQARKVLIKTAETNGVPWRENRRQLELAGIESMATAIANPEIVYPDYYQVPFHAYDDGNLCWQAAFEAESATYAMALRVWKDEPLTWQTAHDRLRHNFYDVVWQYVQQPIEQILDVGCSVGISTHSLHRYCQTHQSQAPRTVGLDLSPQMLAVAKFQDQHQAIADWVHGLAEQMPFTDDSFDLVTLQFVLHELPDQASKNIFQEIFAY
ncbi:MAG: class I SAM-dependent methyltransferase [Synechococcaceae cyanobacterium RL_1_2]|nr:class I SAM-dependent methyltransferase [Synechococcaceae cyanobacterium RL_1_2]